MLILQEVSDSQSARELFSSFDPLTETWLVSDLKTKLDLNRELLTKREFIPGVGVLRASELWKLLLTRVRPDLQVVSREFAIIMIGFKLENFGLDWAMTPGAATTVFNYMTQLMPILTHSGGDESMAAWFKAHPESEPRWRKWHDLSRRLWLEFLKDGFVSPSWMSGVLLNENGFRDVWNRNLIVDLGAELGQAEADLLLLLSDIADVRVLVPEPVWKDEYSKTLSAYEILKGKVGAKRLPLSLHSVNGSKKALRHYRKFTTMIAEVKDATAQIRRWLDQSPGSIRPSEIAVAAPDIEMYWPALSLYLEQEGIAAQKDQVRRLHAFPDVARWLACIRLRAGSYDEADVELAIFDGTETSPPIDFDRFKMLFANVYGREDLLRDDFVAKRFSIDLKANAESTRDEFIAWSLKQLRADCDPERVEALFKRLFIDCPKGMVLPTSRWISYLEELSSRIERTASEGNPEGIAVLNLSSCENSPAKHMIILGLTESSLRQNGGTAILSSDVSSLSREFGFRLSSEDQARLEFEARWIAESAERELVLSVPETDFGGSPQAPSWFWVKGAVEAGVESTVSIPAATRWDEIQQSDFAIQSKVRKWSAPRSKELKAAILEDLAEQEIDKFPAGQIRSLSPSAIEDYLDCPFIYAAKRLFALSDVSELDLEIDASRRGNLMHKLFEMLTPEKMTYEYTIAELEQIVEAAKTATELELADERLWPPVKARHVQLARSFLNAEEVHRGEFRELKTVARETSVNGFVLPATGEIVSQEAPGAIKFVGRIDRIDSDARQNYVIHDYKSSQSSTSNYGSWIKTNQIQLLLYALAVENGLTSVEKGQVVAATYYVAKNMNRDTGFKLVDADQRLFSVGDKRKGYRLEQVDKEALFSAAKELVKKAVEGIQAGRFAPHPHDESQCQTCRWSAVCRAPHLNS